MGGRVERRARTALAGAAVVAGVAAALAAPAAADAAPALVNPGFEDGLTGWTVRGSAGAATAGPGPDGAGRLLHAAPRPYTVRTTQQVGGLADGWYTLEVRVGSGGGLDASTVALTGCGGPPAVTTTPLTEDAGWVRISVSAHVTGGRCTVELATTGRAGTWAGFDDVVLRPGRPAGRVAGADLSSLAKNEDHGAVYRDARGVAGDPVGLLRAAGTNLARLKVWVDPADGYNDTDDVVATALRAEAAGMDVLVDFHYSDRWADPGQQRVPAAWAGYSVERLADAVHDHTAEVLTALADAGVSVDLVQVGNEINSGMLWPYGQTWDVVPGDGVDGPQFDALASFLSAGAAAVRAAAPSAEVMLHLAEGGDVGAFTWWFDEITARGVDFDLIGASYYGFWHGSLAELQHTLDTVTRRYDRDVLVVETAYPFTLDDADGHENIIDLPAELVPGYPATPAGQAAHLRAVADVVAAVPGGRGIVYWEPAWTAVAGSGWDPEDPASGNAWENQALFGFDGRLLPAAAELSPRPTPPR